MKRLNQAFLLGISLGLANVVMAESFKEYSEWMVVSAYPSDTRLNAPVSVPSEHFKGREVEKIILSHGPSQCAVTPSSWGDPARSANSLPNRFNDSSGNQC